MARRSAWSRFHNIAWHATGALVLMALPHAVTAQATGGIEEPESRLGRIGASALRGGVIGGIGGGIVGLWLWFTRRRRRAASSQI